MIWRIFLKKFYRVKNDDSHKIKGSGLGLYLVKYFVELHNGSIEVDSQLAKALSLQLNLKMNRSLHAQSIGG